MSPQGCRDWSCNCPLPAQPSTSGCLPHWYSGLPVLSQCGPDRCSEGVCTGIGVPYALWLCSGVWLVGAWVLMQKEWAQMCYNALPTSADKTKQTVCSQQSMHLSETLAAGARPCRWLRTPVCSRPQELRVFVTLLLGMREGQAVGNSRKCGLCM